MFRVKQLLSYIISQLLSPWSQFCLFVFVFVLFCFVFFFALWFYCVCFGFCIYFFWFGCTCFFIFANGLCCFNFLRALFLFYKWFALLQLSFALLWFPLCCFGSSWLLCSCTIWLPSIARLLCYFVWLLDYLTQLAKYQFDFELLLAIFNTSIAQLLLTLFPPLPFV